MSQPKLGEMVFKKSKLRDFLGDLVQALVMEVVAVDRQGKKNTRKIRGQVGQ